VVGKAVGKAIAAIIGTTLKVLFTPMLLLSAFDASSEGGGVKFAPAPFEVGTTALRLKGRELVDALASLLKQRPKLTVTLCGRSTRDDLEAVLRPEIEAEMAERCTAMYASSRPIGSDFDPLLRPVLSMKPVCPLQRMFRKRCRRPRKNPIKMTLRYLQNSLPRAPTNCGTS